MHWAIAGLLWDTIPRDERKWRSAIEFELRAAPLVNKKLPASLLQMDTDLLLGELRFAIDPNEWVSFQWPDKIKAAQVWLAGEQLVAPGRPPSGPRNITLQRLKMAKILLKEGVGKTEVARRLGISLSNLSHILERHV